MRILLLSSAACLVFIPAAAQAQDAGTAASAASKDIVVTASPFGTDTPTIVAKVDRSQILATGGDNIADSLKDVPGISATNFASGASRPIIRGMDATRVRLLEDGTSSSDVSDIGPDHGVPIDPLSAQSIEVVRGPSTLRYGSQAIGGVINVLNNRVPLAVPAQTVQGEINSSYNTVNNGAEISGLADVNAGGGFVLHADAFYRHTSDYDTPDHIDPDTGEMTDRQHNSYFHGDGVSGGASYLFGDSQIGGAVTHYDANYGIPSDTTHIVMHQTKALTRDTIDISSGVLKKLDFWGSYADYQHQEVEPDGEVDTTFKNREWDGRAELTFNAIGPISNLAIGSEVQRRRFSAIGEDSSYLFPTLTQTESGYVFAEMPLTSRLKLQAAGRVEHTQVNGTPKSDIFHKARFTPVSGSIGALYDLASGVKLGLTASSTGRAPGQTELYARGGHDGPDTYETGDPNLKIERANSLEGTVRFDSGKFRFEGSAYYTWFHNYIFGDLTGRTCDDDGACVAGDGEELKELFYRQQGAHFRGIEGKASYALLKDGGSSLEVNALGDYTRATLSQGGNVPRIAPYRLGGGFTWKSKIVDANLLYLYVGKQDKYGAFDTPTPHYNDLNAQIAVRPFKSNPNIQFAVVGQNLTNDIQRAATALNKDAVVTPGRNVRFVIRFANF